MASNRFANNGEAGAKPADLIPDARATIVAILERMNMNPSGELVSSFMELFEPEREYERRFSKPTKTGRVITVDPYAERIGYQVKKYMSLSGEDQSFIKAAREDGIFWRGDDMAFFQKVCDQNMIMKEIGVSSYRTKAIRSLKNLIMNPQKKAA